MSELDKQYLSKVPAVTLGFWFIKILATTLGETGGDTLSMTYDLGYLASTAVFATILVVLIADLVLPKREVWQTSRIASIGRHRSIGVLYFASHAAMHASPSARPTARSSCTRW